MKYSRKTGKVTVEYDVRYCLPTGGENYIWYDIPGFPSYQYTASGYIRSFKSRRKFPIGQVLMFRHTTNGDVFTLSDRNNIVRELTFDKVKEIVESQIEFLIPYHTYEVPLGKARNIRAFIDPRAVSQAKGKVVKKPKPVFKNGEEASYAPHFTTVPDEEERTIIKPVYFI